MTSCKDLEGDTLVEVRDLYKSYYTPGFPRTDIFRGLSFKIPQGKNVAVLGMNGAGKSTLLRLIAGIERPNRGTVKVRGLPSPPKGFSGGVVLALTGSDNARFVCRIHGLTKRETEERLKYIAHVADIGAFFERPVLTYSNGMKARLNFAINMAFEYDLYLFDELGAVGDQAYRERASALMDERKRSASFIIVSHQMQQIKRDCDAGLFLGDGSAQYYSSLKDAIQCYHENRQVKR